MSTPPLERIKTAAKRLKVFPLPSMVLLPGSAAPLHIFEPRYRAMVKDALDTDSVFALGQLAEGWETDYPGRPGLLPMLCAGVISMSESLDDGRYNLVLTGVARVKVLRELANEQLYREVEVEVVEDGEYQGPEESQLRQALVELAQRVPDEVGDRLGKVTARVHGGALADIVASAVVSEVPERYAVLAQTDVRARLGLVLEALDGLVAQLSPKRGPDGSGGFLN